MERKPFKPNALILQVYLFTAVYKTGAGTRGRGHWDACVRTCDLGTRSLRSCPFPIIPLCLSREDGMIHFFVGSHVKKPESGLFSDWIGNNTDDLRCSTWPKCRHPLVVVDFSLHFFLRNEQ